MNNNRTTTTNNNKIGLESNISLPEQKNEINFNTAIVKNSENSINDKIYIDKLEKSKTTDEQNTKLVSNSKTLPYNFDTKIINKNEPDNNINLENVDNENAFYISPPKLDERASNFRFISSLDNELSNLEKVFNKLDIKLKERKYRF